MSAHNYRFRLQIGHVRQVRARFSARAGKRRILSLFYPFVDLSRELREPRISRGDPRFLLPLIIVNRVSPRFFSLIIPYIRTWMRPSCTHDPLNENVGNSFENAE